MIILNARIYRAVHTIDGLPIVIVQDGRMWRVADPHTTLRVLAGLEVCPLRLVA